MKHSGSVPRASGGRDGFTLIEALVALAIASAGFAVIAQLAGTSLRNWSRGRDGAAVLDMITTGLSQASSDLRHALAVPVKREPGAPVLFLGEPARIVFVSATGLRPGDLGLELISIRAQRLDDGTRLIRERGALSEGLDGRMRDPVTLMQGRLTVRFSYRDEAGRRHDSWADRPALPAAVEIDLLREDGGQILGAAQVFTLPVSYSADCLDPDRDKTGGRERCGGKPETGAARPAAGAAVAKRESPSEN